MFGESGNDRMIWNPGDDTDLMEGGEGNDTAEVNGGNGAEVFTVTANGARVRFDRLDPAPFSIDIGTTENLVLNANGGNDQISATGNLAALIKLTIDAGAGDDTVLGSNGVDVMIGGDGNDFLDGQQGNDVALLGAGDDVFQWDPGDGSDIVEGQAGFDRMDFNGSNANETMDVSAIGGRVRFFRDVANITMDLNDVERIDVKALGGTDTVTVGDMSRHRPPAGQDQPGGDRGRRRRRGRHGRRQRDQRRRRGRGDRQRQHRHRLRPFHAGGDRELRRRRPAGDQRPRGRRRGGGVGAQRASPAHRQWRERRATCWSAAPASTPSTATRATTCCSAMAASMC